MAIAPALSMGRATLRQCVVLPGAASALPVAGRPVLAWRLRELQRFGVEQAVMIGDHPADAALTRWLPRPLAITRADTLRAARPLLDERLLLCRGDALRDANLSPLLAAGRDPPGRMTPEADIAVLARAVFDTADAPDHALLRHLVATNAIGTIALGGWLVDFTRAPDRARAERELAARCHRPALLLDRDGTLNIDHGWVGSRDRFDWMPGAKEAVRLATTRGWHVFVVTNQSGIARGLYDEAALAALHLWMADELRAAGGTIDDLRYCPWHPEAPLPQWRRASDWRKPAPGMPLDLIRAWELTPERCLMIGDRQSDIAAATAAGIAGHLFPGGNLAEFIAPLLAARDGG